MRTYRIVPTVTLVLALASCTSAPGPTTSSTPAATTRIASTAPTTLATTPETAPPDPARITVLMSGDVLVHTAVWETAEADAAEVGKGLPYFTPMFASMQPVVSAADLAICHLETPLSEPAGPYLNYPLFSAPPQVVDGLLATGYDVCTTASNHSVDMGFDGLVRTIDTLDAKGMRHTGTYESKPDSTRPLVLDVDGVSVGLLSYAYGSNGLPVEKPWSVNLIDTDTILSRAHHMREQGAQVVIVAIHAGDEYVTTPNDEQLEVFDTLTASPDVDLVYGHHAHVVQPFDKVNGKWVVYGLGNFVAQQDTDLPDTYRGQTVEFTFVERADGSFRATHPEFVPTMIADIDSSDGIRVLDAPAALHDPSTDPLLLPSLRLAVTSVRTDVDHPGVMTLR